MNYILIIQAIVFSTYVLFIVSLYGTLPSISESYYKLKNDSIVKSSLFTVFITLLAGTMIATFVTLTPGWATEKQILKALPFLGSAVLLMFLGVAPAFKLKLEGWVHIVGAVGGILFALIGLWTAYGAFYWIFIYIAICAFLKWFAPKKELSTDKWPLVEEKIIFKGSIPNYTWWIEIIAFVIIVLGLKIK